MAKQQQRRRRRPDPELERTWRERVSAWASSGLTARAWCRAQGLSDQSFYAWRRKFRERRRLRAVRGGRRNPSANPSIRSGDCRRRHPGRSRDTRQLNRSAGLDRDRSCQRYDGPLQRDAGRRTSRVRVHRTGRLVMLTLPGSTKIFLCTEVADMRRGFDGLAAMTREFIGADPLSGHLFVFRNRRRDRMKILYWDRDGLALWYKRLERGTFRFPAPAEGACSVEVDHATLTLILGGIDVRDARRQRRFQRNTSLAS